MKYVSIFRANLNYAYLVPERYEFVIRSSYELLIDTMREELIVRSPIRRVKSVALFFLLMCGVMSLQQSPAYGSPDVGEAIEASGVRRGMAACIGGGDPDLVSALHASGFRVVHVLDTSCEIVAETRRRLMSVPSALNGPRREGSYGSVSVETWDGEGLPYADNLVNLIVMRDARHEIREGEIERVLAPRGMAIIHERNADLIFRIPYPASRIPYTASRIGDSLVQFTKPFPENTDSWTHYLHGPDGNPVADDDEVATLRQLQWVATPQYSRHHEHMASMSALVSSHGRIFSICDEGPKRAMLHPPRWTLSACDAFNGLLLWKRPLKNWFPHLHPLKNGPASLPRRLVADGERVYVTLGIPAPVSVLDAATGDTLRVLVGTEQAQEIVCSEGTLFLVRGESEGTSLTAVDPRTGEILWDRRGRVITLTLAADSRRVVFFDGRQVVSLNRKDGSEQWVSSGLTEGSRANWVSKETPRLILGEKAVVVASRTRVMALSCSNGKLLWSAPRPRSGYMSPQDLFLIGGLVWYGDTKGADNTGRFDGRDVLTGEVKRSFLPDKDIVWLSHHRCHFSKATHNYIIPSRMGVEFVDLKKEQWHENHWVRGGCVYGVMPCNGLLYTPPHACACYFEAKMNGYAAYSPKAKRREQAFTEEKRLEKGPAYSWSGDSGDAASETDWPVFRHDAARSGSSPTRVQSGLKRKWSADVRGRLTQPVVAGGTLYVASIDRHELNALDAETGETRWKFHAGGRIDSPPSLYQGRVLFGSRDGWVYCLRGTDGVLAWRYRAAPENMRIMVCGQLESAWPVSGSVLIENDEVHFVAGRNMFLDGGLRYLRLDPRTGRQMSETAMDRTDPIQGGTIQKYDSWLDMTTTLPDVLSSDGTNIYMRSLPFDKKGNRRRITHIADDFEPPHLFSPTGFLDGSWFHRTYWTYGRTFPGGWIGHLNAGRYNPSGRLMVLDECAIYGFGRKPYYYRWVTSLEYRLFAVDRKKFKPRDIYAYDQFKERQVKSFPAMKIDRTLGLPSGPNPKALAESYECIWQADDVPLLVLGMVATKDLLFVAGPKDVSDEGQLSYRDARHGYAEIQEHLARQDEVWEHGRQGVLSAISKADGRTVEQIALDGFPVFDGMIAAGGRLYIATQDGRILCLEGSR